MAKYTTVENLTHMEQALSDALRWHHDSFKSDAERAIYRAAFQQGWRDSLSAVKLHAGLELESRRVKDRIAGREQR
jgi:hypothetical protein